MLSALGGCTAFSESEPAGSVEPQQLTPANGALYPLEIITGGAMGNVVVGNVTQRLQRPVTVAVRDHILYIVDAGRDVLYQYDDISKRMSVLKDLRGIVTGDVPDIYVAADRSYYLADAGGRQVLHFDRDGRLLQTFKDSLNLARPVGSNVYCDYCLVGFT